MDGAQSQPRIRIPGVELGVELGRGASSIVYRAVRAGADCAVKIGRGDQREVRWFRREAAALARVVDTGVPAVLEVGETDGVPYLVMEFVDGETLAERLARGPLPTADALGIALELARSLDAIHRRGLVHRDVKPRNVVIQRDERVRLVDLGFATRSRSPTEAAGTRGYAAPEQLRTPVVVDARTDLYALGRLLLECLTGSHVIDGLAELDPPLRRVVEALLEEDADARYPSAHGLEGDLVRVRNGQPLLGPRGDLGRPPEALPFTGRDAEWRQLWDRWSKARSGWGGAALLRGRRGTGKSRMLRELSARVSADDGAAVVQVPCRQLDPRPLSALRALLDGLGRAVVDRGRAEDARRALDGELAPIAAAVSSELATLLGEPPSHHGRIAAEAFAELATEICVRLGVIVGPLLVLIDDAQWVDQGSASVFGRLARRAGEAPVFVLFGGRSETGSGLARLTRELSDDTLRLKLQALSNASVEALVLSYLGGSPPHGLTEWVVQVAEGTPLGVMEVLEAMLDAGALDPRGGAWRFDRERAQRMHLPHGAFALFQRTLRELAPETRELLEGAAVIGVAFEHRLLMRMFDLDAEQLGEVIVEGRRAGLIGPVGAHADCFAHDCVREALLAGMPEERRRELHQRVAVALDDAGDTDAYSLATHYAAGVPDDRPERMFELSRAALTHALEGFDNEAALRFFEAAEAAASRTGRLLDAAILTDAGEAELRLGAHAESAARFELALSRTEDPEQRAAILGRIAWAHQARPDPEASWAALERAFAEVGERLPTESPRSAARAAAGWLRDRMPGRSAASHLEPPMIELLCGLHYQNSRLGLEYGKPARLAQSTLQAHTLAQALGPSPTLAKMEALYGAVLGIFGARGRGREHIERGRKLAADIGNDTVEAYCSQLMALSACFAGDFDRALETFAALIDGRGHWLEVNELTTNVNTAHFIESVRGRPRRAWEWVQRGARRIRRDGWSSGSGQNIALIGRATWAALEPMDDDERFLERLGATIDLSEPPRAFIRTMTWGARARYFTERGDIGPGLEAVVAELEAEGIDPRRAHPLLTEYYIAIAQARLHQCLRSAGGARRRHVDAYDRAVRDLGAVARFPLFEAHLRVHEGALAWLTGSAEKADEKLDAAERLADRELAPRVRYDVARVRAHMLRDQGHGEAAQERARMAAHVAQDQGAVRWRSWVEEELDVHVGSSRASSRIVHSSRSRSSRRHQLQTLVNVLQAGSRQLELEEQARLLVDEVAASVSADRGLLVFEVAGPSPETLMAGSTDHGGGSWREGSPRARALIDEARQSGLPQMASRQAGAGRSSNRGPGRRDADVLESRSSTVPNLVPSLVVPHAIAVPLWLKERVVGSLYLERDAEAGGFSDDDVEILLALSYQVPVALELARAMRERDRLEESLRQAQKMEAVGRFAGGIAHDFNNMLTVVMTTLELIDERAVDDEMREDISIIEEAIASASGLTKQLLTFARRQPRQSATHDLSAALASMAPMLRRLIGATVQVRMHLADTPVRAVVDPALFEQVIFNLALNAKDAMPNGGTLELRAEAVELDEDTARDMPNARPGRHVRITVNDDGGGMSREVRDNAFDPFFTTKERGRGTGLGLSIVYGFVQQCGGSMQLQSELGQGTTFSIYLPAASQRSEAADGQPGTSSRRHRSKESDETILVVEDEAPVRQVLERILGARGYRVVAAERPARALELAQQLGERIDLVISDVLMPEMNGPELARAIHAHAPLAKLLFISGYTDGQLREMVGLAEVPFLQKPFGPEEIHRAVRLLLDN